VTDVSLFTAIGAVITLAAVFGYLNHRFLRLPPTIGLVVIALVASLATIGVDAVAPSLRIGDAVRSAILGIDFHEVLMKGMLSFLLFAGALHVNLGELLSRKWAIGSMATIGRKLAVAEIGRLRLWGFPAWLAWLFVHLMYLAEFQNRVLVLVQWGWSYFTRNKSARLITD